MEKATIVTLEPHTQDFVPTFEEAFGEHSELRGKGRARRQSRKMDRIAKRSERKVARQSGRQERKATRQEARQTKKDTRVTRRLDRKSLRKESRGSQDAPEESQDEATDETPDTQDVQDTQDTVADTGQDGVSSQPSADFEDDQTDIASAQPYDFENGDSTESFDGDGSINPEIQDLTQRVVWNKEMMNKYLSNRNKLNTYYVQLGKSNNGKQSLSEVKSKIEGEDLKIQKHQERIGELNSHLKKYGDHPHIKRGMKMAHTKFQKQREGQMGIKDKAKIQETIVPKGLKAEILPGEIIVPQSPGMKTVELTSGADGSGSKSPVIINVGMSTTTKLFLGVAVLGVAYVLAKKYKYI
jgi:hypothetical protein